MQRILVLGTGGTIAGQAHSDASGAYRSGAIAVDGLLPPGPMDVEVTTEQIANIGSQDMTRDIWRRLHARITSAFASDEADGIIITHGTDTLEETGFFLDLTLPAGRPVVLVSAMRPANAVGSDGARNLVCGMTVAASPDSPERGVLAVLGDRVFTAADAYKATTHGVDGFDSYPRGAVAEVSPSSVTYLSAPLAAPLRGQFEVPDRLPSVAILYVHADMDVAVVEAVLRSGIEGLVIAGVGHGNAPEPVLTALAASGLPVVRSSRIGRARVRRNTEVDDDRLGFIAGGTLNPAKCRILLQLLLAQKAAPFQDAFDRVLS